MELISYSGDLKDREREREREREKRKGGCAIPLERSETSIGLGHDTIDILKKKNK